MQGSAVSCGRGGSRRVIKVPCSKIRYELTGPTFTDVVPFYNQNSIRCESRLSSATSPHAADCRGMLRNPGWGTEAKRKEENHHVKPQPAHQAADLCFCGSIHAQKYSHCDNRSSHRNQYEGLSQSRRLTCIRGFRGFLMILQNVSDSTG